MKISICDLSYKTLIVPKPLQIRFDKIDGFVRIYYGTRYLKLFASEIYDPIYERIKYLRSIKIGITYIFSHYFAKIKVDSYDCLPTENRLTLLMLQDSFNQFAVKIKITTAIRHF